MADVVVEQANGHVRALGVGLDHLLQAAHLAFDLPQPPQSEVDQLRAFVEKQTMVPSAEGASSRYMDLTPYPGLSSPIVVASWGSQLKVSSPADPRLQQFVNKFRASPTYTPEYGGACTGGVGSPLQT